MNPGRDETQGMMTEETWKGFEDQEEYSFARPQTHPIEGEAITQQISYKARTNCWTSTPVFPTEYRIEVLMTNNLVETTFLTPFRVLHRQL